MIHNRRIAKTRVTPLVTISLFHAVYLRDLFHKSLLFIERNNEGEGNYLSPSPFT